MKVTLNDVRASFVNVFDAKAVNDGDPRYSCTLLFGKDHPAVKLLNTAMLGVAQEQWKDKAGAVIAQLKAQDRLAVHDGATKASTYEGFEGQLFVNASNAVRPTIIDGLRAPLTKADGKPYAGCYVNAIVDIWAQDNKFGKRINASLLGVQFLRDGPKLAGGAAPAAADDFAVIADAAVVNSAAAGEENVDASKLFG